MNKITVYLQSLFFIYFIVFLSGTLYGQTPEIHKLKIPANILFDQTKFVKVEKNQMISITATGKWTPCTTKPYGYCGPDGYPPGHMRHKDPDRCAQLTGKLNNQIFNIGSSKTFIASASGKMIFSMKDSLTQAWFIDNDGAMDIVITISPSVQPIKIPGIPVGPGISIPSSNKNSLNNGIQGLSLIEEDREYTWNGCGETLVTLAPGSKISYIFEFSDPFDTTNYTDSFDPFTVANVSQRIFGKHKYKESGASYDIFLTVNLTKRIYNPDLTFKDEPAVFKAGPFKVIVVDHLPEYIGNAFFIISGPFDITDRKHDINEDNVDIIYEDPDINVVNFYITGFFKLFTELPQGIDTGLEPDRFSGIEPGSVKYRIDFGDKTAPTDWIQFEEVNKAKPKTLVEIDKSAMFISKTFSHDYSEPGEYKLKVKMAYKEVEYKTVSSGNVAFTYKKSISKYKYIQNFRKVYVFDRTPPRITSEQLIEYQGTTGDPVKFEFFAEDNHSEKGIKKGILHIQNPKDLNKFIPYSMEIQKTGKSDVKGQCFKLTKTINLFSDFANKNSTTIVPLKYYIELVDEEGNINHGVTTVKEDTPPFYEYKETKDKLNPIEYGELTIFDNDPPDVTLLLSEKEEKILEIKAVEGIDDFQENETEFKELTIENKLNQQKWFIKDKIINPQAIFDKSINTKLKDGLIEVIQGRRYKLDILTTDNVDTGAEKISFGFNGSYLYEEKNVKLSRYFIFSGKKNQTLCVRLNDSQNINGTCAFRELIIPVKVRSTSMIIKTVGKK